MKKIIRNIGLILSAMLMFAACEKEYEAPSGEPNHAYVTTSFGNVSSRVQVNGVMSFIDLSRGVQSRTWTFTSDTKDTTYNELLSSSAEHVKVLFTEPGIHEIGLKQTYAGNVWIGTDQKESNVYDTTLVVNVLDSVRADFTAKRVADMSDLTQANGALNEVIAGRDVVFTPECTGEPGEFKWEVIREDGFTIENEEEVATVKFSSLGKYNVRLTASSGLGSDVKEYTEYIEVVPSTDPVYLLDTYSEMKNEIAMVFSRDMMNPATCDPTAFTLNVTNKSTTIPVSIKGFKLAPQQNNIIIVMLNEDLYNSDDVLVSYDDSKGNLSTTDLMTFKSVSDVPVVFKAYNVMAEDGYDVGFENSTIENWPYDWWGGNWGMYSSDISTAQAKTGKQSLLLDMHAEGGAVFTHAVDGTKITFPVEEGVTYEVGIWVYVDQLGNTDTGDGWSPDLRFYPDDWSSEIAYFFNAEFKVGQWVYMKAEWKAGATRDAFFFIRGYNTSSTINHTMYIDDLVIFEKELR